MEKGQGHIGDPGRAQCANCWRLEHLTWLVGAILSHPGHKILLDPEALRTATMMNLNNVMMQIGVVTDKDGERVDSEPLELYFTLAEEGSVEGISCEHVGAG